MAANAIATRIGKLPAGNRVAAGSCTAGPKTEMTIAEKTISDIAAILLRFVPHSKFKSQVQLQCVGGCTKSKKPVLPVVWILESWLR